MKCLLDRTIVKRRGYSFQWKGEQAMEQKTSAVVPQEWSDVTWASHEEDYQDREIHWVKPHDYPGTGLTKFYHIIIFLVKSIAFLNSLEHQSFEVWALESFAWSEHFPFKISQESRCLNLQCFMGGWPEEKKVDRKPVFPQTVRKSIQSPGTLFLITWQK